MRVQSTFSKQKLQNLKKALRKVQKDPELLLHEKISEGVLMIHATAIKNISSRSQGESETRYKPKRQVTVSRPGDAPNTDRGTLVKSIIFEVDAGELRGVVGSNLSYAKDLEFGTKKMDARPWLAPAFREWLKKKGKNFFKINLRKVVNK